MADKAALRPQLDLAEAEHELRAQIAKVEATGLALTHLDGHMFFYKPAEDGCLALQELVRGLAAERGLAMRDRSVRRTHFIWEGYDDCASRAAFYTQLLETYDDEAELILHPGDDAAAIGTFSRAAGRRLGDYAFFADPAWRARVAARGIEVIGWGDEGS